MTCPDRPLQPREKHPTIHDTVCPSCQGFSIGLKLRECPACHVEMCLMCSDERARTCAGCGAKMHDEIFWQPDGRAVARFCASARECGCGCGDTFCPATACQAELEQHHEDLREDEDPWIMAEDARAARKREAEYQARANGAWADAMEGVL